MFNTDKKNTVSQVSEKTCVILWMTNVAYDQHTSFQTCLDVLSLPHVPAIMCVKALQMSCSRWQTDRQWQLSSCSLESVISTVGWFMCSLWWQASTWGWQSNYTVTEERRDQHQPFLRCWYLRKRRNGLMQPNCILCQCMFLAAIVSTSVLFLLLHWLNCY